MIGKLVSLAVCGMMLTGCSGTAIFRFDAEVPELHKLNFFKKDQPLKEIQVRESERVNKTSPKKDTKRA